MATVRKARWPAVVVVVAAWFGASMSRGPAPVRAEDPPAPPMGEPAPAPTERPPRKTLLEVGVDAPPSASGDMDLMIGDGLTVEALLKAVALVTRQPIVWTETDKTMYRQFKAAIRVRVRKEDLLALVRDLLAAHEVAMIPLGPPGSPVWFALDARYLVNHYYLRQFAEPVLLDDDRARELEHRAGLFVNAVVPVPLDDLREARAAVQHLVTGNNVGSVTELPSARAFLVTDFAPQAVAVYRALQALRPRGGPPGPDDPLIDAYTFETLGARDTALGTLRDLFVERAGAPQPTPVPAAGGPTFSARLGDLRLLAKGTSAELELVRVAVTACGGRFDGASSSPR